MGNLLLSRPVLREETRFCHGSVYCYGIVSCGKQKTVASFPLRIIRMIFHSVEIQNGQKVCRPQRLRDKAALVNMAHS